MQVLSARRSNWVSQAPQHSSHMHSQQQVTYPPTCRHHHESTRVPSPQCVPAWQAVWQVDSGRDDGLRCAATGPPEALPVAAAGPGAGVIIGRGPGALATCFGADAGCPTGARPPTLAAPGASAEGAGPSVGVARGALTAAFGGSAGSERGTGAPGPFWAEADG